MTTADGTPTDELKEHRLFPQSREEAPAKWRYASPVSHVRKDSPPTLSLHGTKDKVVDREQSEEIHRALQLAGADSTLIRAKGAGHAWPLRTSKFDYTDEVTAFFNQHLKN